MPGADEVFNRGLGVNCPCGILNRGEDQKYNRSVHFSIWLVYFGKRPQLMLECDIYQIIAKSYPRFGTLWDICDMWTGTQEGAEAQRHVR